ncbi:MAG: phosphonopyruvate decarboxylase [Lachnospiraceae bacterium]|nr:phosphonopyruvate decarboxylase [Lachnospiraceae bacterium]
MNAKSLLSSIEHMGIEVITGVPDSTLKQFCDGLQTYEGNLKHYVPVNEGAAIGIAVGTYLSSGHPACVYMQNSGLGNIVNPITSLANEDVYGIPMLLIVGWRGEPGLKDEPQHVFQGKITKELLEVLSIPYVILDADTPESDIPEILQQAKDAMAQRKQFALIVRKGTFEKADKFEWENEYPLNREAVLGELLQMIPQEACIVSTTGKISRELYEQSDKLYGNHDRLFMTVGGMGHASMIAFGIAQNRNDRQVVCIDGDGAALMHMGGLAFLAANAPQNFMHIVINNQAHESVGAMPTGAQQVSIAKVAEAAGYKKAIRITKQEELSKVSDLLQEEGPVLCEIMVGLASRADLGRPKETAAENRASFMKYLQEK